jgi:hypothetical protein
MQSAVPERVLRSEGAIAPAPAAAEGARLAAPAGLSGILPAPRLPAAPRRRTPNV